MELSANAKGLQSPSVTIAPAQIWLQLRRFNWDRCRRLERDQVSCQRVKLDAGRPMIGHFQYLHWWPDNTSSITKEFHYWLSGECPVVVKSSGSHPPKSNKSDHPSTRLNRYRGRQQKNRHHRVPWPVRKRIFNAKTCGAVISAILPRIGSAQFFSFCVLELMKLPEATVRQGY